MDKLETNEQEYIVTQLASSRDLKPFSELFTPPFSFLRPPPGREDRVLLIRSDRHTFRGLSGNGRRWQETVRHQKII